MNRVLAQQIEQHFKNHKISPELNNLLAVISGSYDQHEKERTMLEQQLQQNTGEIISLNVELENCRAAEEKCRQQEAHLRASQGIAHVGSWELNIVFTDTLSFNSVYISEEAYDMLNIPHHEEISTELFYSRVHPDDRDKISMAMQDAIENGKPLNLEHRIVLPDGTLKLVHELAEIIYNEKGFPVRVLGTMRDITEQKKAEDTLNKTSRELYTLFETMRECFFSVDIIRNQTIQISKSCKSIYGRSVEEFLAKADLWYDLILEEDKHIIQGNYARINAGEPIIQTYRINHSSGEIRWLETRITPTLNEDKVMVRIDGITSDVTEREEIQKAIRLNEHRFRSLIEHTADAIMIVDENSNVSYVSNSLQRIMGYSPEEVIGVPSFNFVWPEDLPALKQHLKKLVETPGMTITTVYRRLKKDGSLIWCEGSATNFLHEPAIKGVVINFRDITEKREAEMALKHSEYKFRSLIEYSSDVITVLDHELKIVFASDSLSKVTGYEPDEVLGIYAKDFIHPDDLPEVADTFRALLKHPGQAITTTYRRLKKDGSYIWCEGVVNNLMHQPAVQGIVVNFRDITDRKEAAQALEQTNLDLKKANNELDKFVYSASHDLRAPLSSMLGVLPLLESQTTDPLMLNDIGLLKKSINKLDSFILNILDYARNSRLEVKQEPVDLHSMLNSLINNLKYMGDVDIRLQLDPDTKIYSDASRLEVIFNNLISNAIRYRNTDNQKPYVAIKTRSIGDKVSIIIEDNGIGISDDHQPKVFDMFYRVSKKSTGSGIGLYIVKETVEKLNGSIMLSSEPGVGTTFNILLPNLTE